MLYGWNTIDYYCISLGLRFELWFDMVQMQYHIFVVISPCLTKNVVLITPLAWRMLYELRTICRTVRVHQKVYSRLVIASSWHSNMSRTFWRNEKHINFVDTAHLILEIQLWTFKLWCADNISMESMQFVEHLQCIYKFLLNHGMHHHLLSQVIWFD